MGSIKKVEFPAVSLCFPTSGKWIALFEALKKYGGNGKIFEMLSQLSMYERSIYMRIVDEISTTLKKMYQPNLKYDRELYTTLNFKEIDIELLSLIQVGIRKLNLEFSDYFANVGFLNKITDRKTDIIFYHNLTATESYEDLKNLICLEANIDCSFTNEKKWWLCKKYQATSYDETYKNWCENCQDFRECSENDNVFDFILWYYYVENYFTEENLLKATVNILLDDHLNQNGFDSLTWFDVDDKAHYFEMFQLYHDSINILPNLSTLNMLDISQSGIGNVNDIAEFESFLNQSSTENIHRCKLGNKVSCDALKVFEKDIYSSEDLLELIDQPEVSDFIPFCSFDASDMLLQRCEGQFKGKILLNAKMNKQERQLISLHTRASPSQPEPARAMCICMISIFEVLLIIFHES